MALLFLTPTGLGWQLVLVHLLPQVGELGRGLADHSSTLLSHKVSVRITCRFEFCLSVRPSSTPLLLLGSEAVTAEKSWKIGCVSAILLHVWPICRQ
jgi:hypothetical protein